MYKQILPLLIALRYINSFAIGIRNAPEFSKAGFYEAPNCGQEVFNFNLGWRLSKGDIAGAEKTNFDDSNWKVVNCPNGIEYNSAEASGSCNYQGKVRYRKHFQIENSLSDKSLKVHFETIMGKCKIYLNGKQIGEHFGGYLPIIVELNENLNFNGDNVLAVWTDNSDDPTYPPGKPQTELEIESVPGNGKFVQTEIGTEASASNIKKL